MKRGRPMRAVSEKRQERYRDRERAVDRAFARDRWTCVAGRIIPEVECGGRLDPHEVIPRSAWPEGIYDTDNIVAVCRRHHEWIDHHPDGAHAVGLHGYSHERTDDEYPERH